MSPPAKRARTEQTALDYVRDAIERIGDLRFDASPGNEAPQLFSELISSLRAAAALMTSAPSPPTPVKLHPNLTPLWTAAIAALEPGKLQLVQTVMRDIEAGMPKLDEMGILLRPYYAENKIDPLVWEFGLPGRAGTEWAGSLIKGTLKFKEG
ncbi:hypothetical protein JCM11491_001810 [Sporobolomyces phaffii]